MAAGRTLVVASSASTLTGKYQPVIFRQIIRQTNNLSWYNLWRLPVKDWGEEMGIPRNLVNK